ncbi:hypothetical protein LA6_004756 [Marinibacterium anthonyi]|nr:hypothetical protein LA6_004756 [Marinibacterium anthonyi]
MAKHVKMYDVFISSPSDVAMERDTVEEAIDQINRLRGTRDGFRLNPVRWEHDVSSQIGSSPQTVINEQIGDGYDIFVGILCARFGQKTDSYESGTEEEFSRAYQRKIDGDQGLEILFYFKDPRKSEGVIDPEQLVKVADFKKKISSLGVYESFETYDRLKTLLVAALVKAVERLEAREDASGSSGTIADSEAVSDPLDRVALVGEDDLDEDIGLFELADNVSEALENLTTIFDNVGAETETLGNRINARTIELSELNKVPGGKHDQNRVRSVMEKVATELHRYSDVLDAATPDAKKQFSTMLRNMQHAIIISSQDGIGESEDVEELVRQLNGMRAAFLSIHVQISQFEQAIASTPRMTSKLNRAKRRAVGSIGDLLDFISDGPSSIDATLNAISG